ncbi:hypothetical protein ACFXTH_045882 [Malus domestica]|uniref:Fe-S metabolism associated domain-containing protein n=1 Tax=Malus domestica TaxID=3750 RepID=A0A498J5Y3_MALDO|nr:hypothetical protein DVH24_032502 [Malus domestica]
MVLIVFSSSPSASFKPNKSLTFKFNTSWVKHLLHYATLLPPFDDSSLVDSKQVIGCTARVWLQAEMDEEGKMRFAANNNSEITKGFYFCLVLVLDDALPEEVLQVKTGILLSLSVGLSGA